MAKAVLSRVGCVVQFGPLTCILSFSFNLILIHPQEKLSFFFSFFNSRSACSYRNDGLKVNTETPSHYSRVKVANQTTHKVRRMANKSVLIIKHQTYPT